MAKTIKQALSMVKPRGTILVESGTYAEALDIQNPVTISADENSAGQVVLEPPTAGGCIVVALQPNSRTKDVILKELTINSCITTANASLTLDDVVMKVSKGPAIKVLSGELNLGGKPPSSAQPVPTSVQPVPTSVRMTGSGKGDNDGVLSALNATVNVQDTVLSGFKSALKLNSTANLRSGTKITNSAIGLEIAGAPPDAEIFEKMQHPTIDISDAKFENNSTGIQVDPVVLLQKLTISKTTIVHYVPQTNETDAQTLPSYARGILIGKPVATSTHPASEILVDDVIVGHSDLTANPAIADMGVGIESQTPLTIRNTVLNGNASGVVLGGPALEMPDQKVGDYALDGVKFQYNNDNSIGLEIASSIPRRLSIINKTTWQGPRKNEFVAPNNATVTTCEFKIEQKLSSDSKKAIKKACKTPVDLP